MFRLLLVNDYQMEAEALALRLAAAPCMWVGGCYSTDDPKLAEIIRWLRPDVLLVDVEPLGPAISEVVPRFRAAWPKARVVVISSNDDVEQAVDAARHGVEAWTPKDQGVDELEAVIRGVCEGQAWYPPRLLGEILRRLRDDVRRARDDFERFHGSACGNGTSWPAWPKASATGRSPMN